MMVSPLIVLPPRVVGQYRLWSDAQQHEGYVVYQIAVKHADWEKHLGGDVIGHADPEHFAAKAENLVQSIVAYARDNHFKADGLADALRTLTSQWYPL